MSSVIVHIDAPLLTQEEYARRSGLTLEMVKKRVASGFIPSVQFVKPGNEQGPYMVNNALLLKFSLEQEVMKQVVDGSYEKVEI